MIDKERLDKGLWWGKAWKLIEGCTKISPGCDNCWSETETVMRSKHRNEKICSRALTVTLQPDKTDEENWGNSFNGEILCREDNLELPLRTKKPTVFAIWNDLYHEGVPDDFRDRAYAVMALCPQHIFLVLTKRAQRMAGYWMKCSDPLLNRMGVIQETAEKKVGANNLPLYPLLSQGLPNIWHGVTVENQEQADARIPHLLKVPGKRFLSIEPMLSAIDLSAFFGGPYVAAPGDVVVENYNMGIDAILLGGESGKSARPMHPDWVRSIRDQCAAAGVPFFFKQNGEWAPHEVVFDTDKVPSRAIPVATFFADQWRYGRENPSHDGSYPEYEPDVWRIGKKKAGRTLDGRLHDALPWKEKDDG